MNTLPARGIGDLLRADAPPAAARDDLADRPVPADVPRDEEAGRAEELDRRKGPAGKEGPKKKAGAPADFAAALADAAGVATALPVLPPALPKAAPRPAAPAAASLVAAGEAAATAGARTRAAARREGAAPREAEKADVPGKAEAFDAKLARETQALPPAPAETGEVRRAAPGVEAARPVLPVALADPGLGGAIHARAAHLSLDAGDAGAIGLHLRVRDGVADVRIDGAVAPVVEARSAELRLALAKEGIVLGSLDLGAGSGDPSRHGTPERPEAPEPGASVRPAGGPATAPSAPRGGAAPAASGRIHVEA